MRLDTAPYKERRLPLFLGRIVSLSSLEDPKTIRGQLRQVWQGPPFGSFSRHKAERGVEPGHFASVRPEIQGERDHLR